MVLGAMLLLTTAPAFASTVYLNNMESQVENNLYVRHISGFQNTYDVSNGDLLAWQNVLKNQDSADSSVYCGIRGNTSEGVTSSINYNLGQITYGQTIGPAIAAEDVTANPTGQSFFKWHYYSTSSSSVFSSTHWDRIIDTIN